jgi:hypothetical protein
MVSILAKRASNQLTIVNLNLCRDFLQSMIANT